MPSKPCCHQVRPLGTQLSTRRIGDLNGGKISFADPVALAAGYGDSRRSAILPASFEEGRGYDECSLPLRQPHRITGGSSTNGTCVSGVRITTHDLSEGEVARIGDYELEYTTGTTARDNRPLEGSDDALYELAEEQPASPRSTISAASGGSPITALVGPTCPSCGQTLGAGAKICIDCGIDVQTGRPLLTARAVDEDVLCSRAGASRRQTRSSCAMR